MIMCLDIGNSQIYGGVYDEGQSRLQFRHTTSLGASSDQFGLFLRSVLRENNIDPQAIRQIALCSVVPSVVHSLRNACKKYFSLNPFVLQAGTRTGLKVKYRNPVEVGSDRIANAIAAQELYPQQNLIVVDFGTATTFCAISKQKEYLGGVIIAGMRLSMEALEAKTAKLPAVEITVPQQVLGRSTVESLQSGLYFGHVGEVREICHRLTQECFEGERPKVIGTGGFSSLLEGEGLFDIIIPDLVLQGLFIALKMNS